MYKCEDCGHIFEDGEQATWKEDYGETFFGCPICKGDCVEIKPCKICGSYEHDENEQYCDNCKERTKNKFNGMMEKEFTMEERKLINELYDGENI